ncbi:MAG: raffinose/stachyose/melibiose transport system permease protein [Frankiales bacterium]|nr:raffinose/stachyose/melibiose transport system permease protein [Frankiales bacterium]
MTSTESATTGATAGRASTARLAAPQLRRSGRGGGRKAAELTLFVGPAFVLYAAFALAPIVLAFYYSFYNWNGITPLTHFIGLGNYRRAFHDPVFLESVRHNFYIVFLTLLVQLPIALGVASLLNARLRGRAVLRTIFFAPYVLSEVITAVIWQLMLQPDSLADNILKSLGLGGLVQGWLSDPKIALWTLFVVATWKYIGFGIILLLAGLQGIPGELTEAAEVDGASRWDVFRHIKLPLLGPTIRIWAFLSIIGSLQLFDLVYILTGGGPINATSTMVTYMTDHGFHRFQFGYGSAIAVVLFLISFVFSLAYQRFVLRRDTEGALTSAAR